MPGQIEELNNLTPGSEFAELGTKLNQVIVLINEMHDDHATARSHFNELDEDVEEISDAVHAVLGKMDSDTGINDTDYQSTYGQGGSAADVMPPNLSTSPPATLTSSKADTLTSE